MIGRIGIRNGNHEIPAVWVCPDGTGPFPVMILCHGTASHKDEVGNLFVQLANRLAEQGIASIRFDYAGCGESREKEEVLTFSGEIEDTCCIYHAMCQFKRSDQNRVGILGFSQGARIMAAVLDKIPKLHCAVSWSGACQEHAGIFENWYQYYYPEAVENGYARIPMDWREDLRLSKQWFEEIQASTPLSELRNYKGPLLAVGGEQDQLVPSFHAEEILRTSSHPGSELILIPHADHIYNVLTRDRKPSEILLTETVRWIKKYL